MQGNLVKKLVKAPGRREDADDENVVVGTLVERSRARATLSATTGNAF